MKNLFILSILTLTLFSCRLDGEGEERKGPLHIVATTGIIADCLREIVQENCEVTSLMGPGTDPHIYKPTPGDIEMLEEADVIIANGLHLEGKMAEVLEKYGKEKPVLFVSDGIEESNIIKSADFEDACDPHIWFDPTIWSSGLNYIAVELGKIDTTNAAVFMINMTNYKTRIEEADNYIRSQLAMVPEEKRILVTSHDAFSYFGRYYGVQVKGIQGISTLGEVGLKDIADMVDFVVENDLNAIFIETSTSEKTAQSIVDGCAQRKFQVSLSGPLYSDALGEPDTDAGTYLGMIKENAFIISSALR